MFSKLMYGMIFQFKLYFSLYSFTAPGSLALGAAGTDAGMYKNQILAQFVAPLQMPQVADSTWLLYSQH